MSLQSVESELQQVRDTSSHQKKRVVDMMTNLMKDLADIGSSIGSEFKVCCTSLKVVVYLYIESLLRMKIVVAPLSITALTIKSNKYNILPQNDLNCVAWGIKLHSLIYAAVLVITLDLSLQNK